MKPVSLPLLIAILLALAFPQASHSAARDDLIEAAKKEHEVVFYTTINLEEAGTMSRHFKAKYPFLEVNINRADGERIVTRVLQESRSKKYLVDVIQTPAFYLHAFRKEEFWADTPRQRTVFFRETLKKRNIGPRLITIPMSFFTIPSSSPRKTCPS